MAAQFIELLPFFFARQLLRDADDNEQLLRALVVSGLLYSLPMLFEVRMSPHLHKWLYGAFPSSFSYINEVRDGGFRPVVFMPNGLVVALFTMTSTVAAATFWRTNTPVLRSVLPSVITAYLGGVLVLCKALGALVLGAVFVPLVRFARPRLQMRIALVLVTLALLYPTLRATDFFPVTSLVEVASSVSAERAASLQTRFDQEDQLLQRASQRFWFGWGRFARSRVYDEFGADRSITDGQWIITMGEFGYLGFLAEFGLLAIIVLRAASGLKFVTSERDAAFLAALTLIVAAIVVDQLPNASLSPWSWLLTGALVGRAEALRAAGTRKGVFEDGRILHGAAVVTSAKTTQRAE
jgi:hypothetical protein